MGIINVPVSGGTSEQNRLIYQGTRAVVAAPILAWASLANGQTFVTITPALATDSRTINAALAASTDRPTFCAALAAELNTANTTAYVWTVNALLDGLVGTAKAPGIAFNAIPTGTALTGEKGSVTTVGLDPMYAQGTKLESLASGGWQDTVSKLFDLYAPNSTDWGYLKPGAYPLGKPTLPAGMTEPDLSGAPIRLANGIFYWSALVLRSSTGSPPTTGARGQPWAVAFDVATVPPIINNQNIIGLYEASEGQFVYIKNDYAMDTTRWVLKTFDGASADPDALGPVIDSARHTIILAYDKANLRVIIDGVVVIDVAAPQHLPLKGVALWTYTTGSVPMDVYQMAWRV
jgi:hypothetical protein